MQKYWLRSSKSRYKSISLDQETALYFWYMIVIHPDEATDSSVFSWACFNDLVLKCSFEKVVYENNCCEAQNH